MSVHVSAPGKKTFITHDACTRDKHPVQENTTLWVHPCKNNKKRSAWPDMV